MKYHSALNAGCPRNPRTGAANADATRLNWKAVLILLTVGGWTWAVADRTSKYFLKVN